MTRTVLRMITRDGCERTIEHERGRIPEFYRLPLQTVACYMGTTPVPASEALMRCRRYRLRMIRTERQLWYDLRIATYHEEE